MQVAITQDISTRLLIGRWEVTLAKIEICIRSKSTIEEKLEQEIVQARLEMRELMLLDAGKHLI